MHAHQPGEDLAFYRAAEVSWGRVLWLYVQIDRGDLISEIWKRSGRLDRELALLFRTTNGHLYQLGPQQRAGWDCTWTLLDRPTPELGSVSYDFAEFGISELAFETPQPQHIDPDPMLLLPPSPFPEATSLQDYFYSAARLDSVIDVAQCMHPSARRITGLLFHRDNGDQVSVGEVRLERLGPPIKITGSAKLWLGFVSTIHGVFVQSMELSRPRTASPMVWLDVPFRGLLEWWFSFDQCKVYYDGRASPPTRL